VGDVTYPGDAVLGIGLTAFMNGSREFKLLFEPGPRRSYQGSFWAAGTLTLSILDDLANVYLRVDPAAGWSVTPMADVPAIGVVSVWPIDVEEDERDGTLLMSVQDPLTPSTLALIEPGQAPAVLKRSPTLFDTAGLTVTRHEAVSTDGERIPYIQVGPERPPHEAPVLMSGYGGFGVTERPWYSPGVGKVWLERGGVYVLTHIRGGGEFGTRWHDAGRNAGKRLSHDDFAAIAKDLVLRSVTVPRRIAAMGGSNGGILISNMLTRYPDRFGALLCTVPLIDMRRYSKLLAGASWIAEYGDPETPSDWAHLAGYSAYHAAIDPAKPYPSILIATTRKDDRVHPGHARKFCAKLQELGLDAHYFEPAAGGHSAGKDNAERAIFTAIGYRFLREKIGWSA
jgi:prolyl oligopeptidase